MNLKQEFLAALRAGEEHRLLIDLVHRHQAQGMSSQQAYDILEEIWRELGLDEKIEDSPLRQELEYVMEKVWFQGTRNP